MNDTIFRSLSILFDSTLLAAVFEVKNTRQVLQEAVTREYFTLADVNLCTIWTTKSRLSVFCVDSTQMCTKNGAQKKESYFWRRLPITVIADYDWTTASTALTPCVVNVLSECISKLIPLSSALYIYCISKRSTNYFTELMNSWYAICNCSCL